MRATNASPCTWSVLADQSINLGNGSALQVVLHDYALYKSTFTLLTLLENKWQRAKKHRLI